MKKYSSYTQVREDLFRGAVTCTQLAGHHLEQIQNKNPLINAFLEVFGESSMAQARRVDEKIQQGNAGKLAGLVVGIKDLFCYDGHRLTCSSKILEGFESQITATAVQRLINEDAIIIGRQNCDEFAMGSSNENSTYKVVRNPHDPERVPGGSSGGSAAAVASGMCMLSIGSDTGGSVRQPASFCGVVGLKPTYSRISRYGLTAYSSSFDTVGILSKTIEDAALILEVIAGEDKYDGTSSKKEVPEYTNQLIAGDKCKIALIKDFNEADGFEEDVKSNFAAIVDELKSAGHEFGEIEFPYLDYLLPTYYILTSAEASANLSRYDGVRYGYRVPDPKDMESMYKNSRTIGFGKEVLRRILLGTFVLSASYHDAFYTKAQKARNLIRQFTLGVLKDYDFIMMPTTPTAAFGIGSKTLDPIQMYLSDLFTVQASVSGIPAISIPKGVDHNGMPLGIQLMNNAFEEGKLLRFSKEIEEL